MQDISFCLGFQVLYLVVSPLFTLFCIKINEKYCNVSHLEAFSKCLVRLKNNHVSYIFCQVLPNVSSVFPSYFDSNLTHLKYNLKRELKFHILFLAWSGCKGPWSFLGEIPNHIKINRFANVRARERMCVCLFWVKRESEKEV